MISYNINTIIFIYLSIRQVCANTSKDIKDIAYKIFTYSLLYNRDWGIWDEMYKGIFGTPLPPAT
jgi:hypothetical protein